MQYSPLKYKFLAAEKISARPTIILFHGNNGSENDLLPLATWFAYDINILSVRGNTCETGPTNFINDHKDEAELIFRTNELILFLKNFIVENKISDKKIVAMGFSNGADIINYSLTLFPDFFTSVVLMRTQSFLWLTTTFSSLKNTPVLISTGKNDERVVEKEISDWAEKLKQNNFEVEHFILDEGHNLSQKDIDMAVSWMARRR